MARFKPGQSGNPAGKPKGARDKRTELRELLRPHAVALIETAVQMALSGDATALRLCLDRLVPPLRGREEPVTLGALAGTLTEQGQSILQATAEGRLTPAEASSLLSALSAQARIVEVDELQQRVSVLEGKLEKP